MTQVVAPAIPDVLGDMRTWLRGLPSIQSFIAGRAFFAWPKDATFPAIRLAQVGGPLGVEIPLDNPRLSIEIASSAASQFAAISAVSNLLKGELFILKGPIGETTFVLGAQVNTAFDSADPETLMPRKFLDVTMTVRAQ